MSVKESKMKNQDLALCLLRVAKVLVSEEEVVADWARTKRVRERKRIKYPKGYLRNLMRRFGVTIRELAEKQQLTLKRIREVLNDDSLPKLKGDEWALMIAEATGKNVSHLWKAWAEMVEEERAEERGEDW